MRVAVLAVLAALFLAGCGPDQPEEDLSRFVAPAPGRVSAPATE